MCDKNNLAHVIASATSFKSRADREAERFSRINNTATKTEKFKNIVVPLAFRRVRFDVRNRRSDIQSFEGFDLFRSA